MRLISFTVPGEPVAKGRARSFVRNGRVGHYTPVKTVTYENLVTLYALNEMRGDPVFDGPVCLTVNAYLSIPKSWSLKKKVMAESEDIVPTKRPDLDNIIKSIKDGLNKVIWHDDAQVIDVVARKRYGLIPRIEIEIREV